ncbi:MAG: Smr/MutS family protein [Eubacteriales bacterium]|nr:Smr/MutS family protein [Eubacteriales bacterium]
MINSPIIEMDLHGMYVDDAIRKIEQQIKKAPVGTYRIRIIHGFNRGNSIQRAIYRDILPELFPNVKRIVGGDNPGITEIILREY